jgi:hypothetical protein
MGASDLYVALSRGLNLLRSSQSVMNSHPDSPPMGLDFLPERNQSAMAQKHPKHPWRFKVLFHS